MLQRIPSNEKTKAIFFLDQTGWNHATLNHCNRILTHLPKAEIIWNISIESLAKFANANSDFHEALVDELAPRVRELGNSPTVATLMASIANETPADRTKVYRALGELRAEGEFSIVGPNNERRRAVPQSLDDRLVLPSMRQFRLSGM